MISIAKEKRRLEQPRSSKDRIRNGKNSAKEKENEKMKNIKVRLTFTEGILGTSPANADIYRDFIGSKAPDAASVADEVEALGVDAVVEKGMTVFPKLPDGTPILYDYQIKGFFKDTCGGLRKVTGTESSKVKAFKKEIDKLIFVRERQIAFENISGMGVCQRPLRASTAQGERVSLAMSEEINAGATVTFTIALWCDSHEKLVKEWLNYGEYSGIGQWRNSGKGRFLWEELDEQTGEVIGGNLNSRTDA